MKRDYKEGIKSTPIFFTGTEVEHTPAFGLHTLFVVDIQDPEEVVEYVDKNIGEKEIDLFDKYTNGELSSAAEIANEAGEAHAVIVKMKGDFPRKIMPQASHSGAVGGQDGVNKALSRGAINYKEPYGESIDLAKWKKIARI